MTVQTAGHAVTAAQGHEDVLWCCLLLTVYINSADPGQPQELLRLSPLVTVLVSDLSLCATIMLQSPSVLRPRRIGNIMFTFSLKTTQLTGAVAPWGQVMQ